MRDSEMGLPEGTYWSVGGRVDRAKAGLRIQSQFIDAAEVTRLLGVEPTEVTQGRGRMMWHLRAPDSQADLDAAVRWILEKLPDNRDIWREISRVCESDVLCGVFLHEVNRGFELSEPVLAGLALRGLRIGFDIYYVGRRSEGEA